MSGSAPRPLQEPSGLHGVRARNPRSSSIASSAHPVPRTGCTAPGRREPPRPIVCFPQKLPERRGRRRSSTIPARETGTTASASRRTGSTIRRWATSTRRARPPASPFPDLFALLLLEEREALRQDRVLVRESRDDGRVVEQDDQDEKRPDGTENRRRVRLAAPPAGDGVEAVAPE